MAHHNTVFSQILKLVPRHEFEALAKVHHQGRSFRTASRWSQFVCLSMAQLTGRNSLRDMVENISAQAHRLYHLGSAKLSRSNLSRINEDKPYALYEALFGQLLKRCQSHVPQHQFNFENKLYSLDASTVDLCLSMFPWAKFKSTKSAVKLHVGLNHQGYLPEFVTITEGNVADITIGRTLEFPKKSIVVIDRGYVDHLWYKRLTKNEIFFVTRLKVTAKFRVLKRHNVDKTSGVTSDQTIQFVSKDKPYKCPIPLRRVGYRDPKTGKHYSFLTNNFELPAKTIADIYKSRWQVELFFKWIKQNLKIKSFIGTSRNAVMTQIWVALCMYLLLAFLKFQSKLRKSMQQILRLLQLNLFEKRDLMALLKGDPPMIKNTNINQMGLI